jgi:hypothetical protein
MTIREARDRLRSLGALQRELLTDARENGCKELPPDSQRKWDALDREDEELREKIAHAERQYHV